MEWGNDQVNEDTGIVAGKKALNDLHYFLGKNGYKQVSFYQIKKLGARTRTWRPNRDKNLSIVCFRFSLIKSIQILFASLGITLSPMKP